MTKISQWVTTMASKTPGSAVSLVGQGSILDKPSLHMVGYMGKNPHSSNAPHDGWCPVCKTKGQTQALKTYRINFTQSIFLCTNPQCIYPLGYTPLDNIIANTADLKNRSPNKQQKRDFSSLSPTPHPSQKRPKTDLPVVGDSRTVQADPCTFLPGFPALENETSSQPGLKECTDSQMQNVSGTSNSFSSSAVRSKSSFSNQPLGSPSRYAPSEPNGSPAVQDDHQEELQDRGLEVMDTLNNGSLLPLHPETDHSIGKVQEEVKQSSDTEMTESLSEEGNLNGPAFRSDHMPSCVSPRTPLLLESQVNKNSSKEASVPQSNIDNVSDLECRLQQSCEFAPSGPDGSPAVQDDHQEALQNRGLKVVDTLNNGSLLPLHPETDHSMGKVQEEVKQSSDTEMTESLSEEVKLNGLAFSSDHMPSCVSPRTPLLKNCQEESQVNESSSKEASVPQSNIHNVSDLECRLQQSCEFAPSGPDGSPAVQDDHQEALQNRGLEVMDILNNDSLLPLDLKMDHSVGKVQEDLECRLQQSCEFFKDNLCLVEPPKEQMENTDDGNVETTLCNREASPLIPDSQLEMSANTVTSKLEQEETEHQMNLSSLLDLSPPTCPEVAVQENLSESLQLMQESRDVTATSQSLQGCLADLCKPLSSPSCVVAEDSEKGLSTLPSCEIKECQPEGMSIDNLDIPLDLSSPVPNGSVVSAEDPSTPIPNSSLLQELVQNCQNMNSKEHNPSNSLQDLQPESQVEESVLNTCDSPTTSLPPVEDQTFAGASAISLPGEQKSEECDTARVCQENDMASPDDTLVGNRPVHHSDDGTSKSECEPHDISASMTDDCSAQRGGKPINKMSLPDPQVVLQDCLKCHCGMIIPSQNLRKITCDDPTASAASVKDQACSDASAIALPHSSSTAVLKGDGNDKSLNKMYLPGPQILLQDCLKCHCGRNIPARTLQNTPTKDSVSEMDSSSCEAKAKEVSALSDIEKDSSTAEKPLSTQPVECESKQKKKFYENTTLPDLLLDIQPEHRMEESLSAVPSPACEATESMTPPSDMEITKQDVWQNERVKESDHVMETEGSEILNDSVQDGSKLSNTLETSLNSDESHEAMETKDEDPAEDVKAPARKRLKVTEKRLQWKNKHSLCWLDCILSALVQSETIIRFVEKGRHLSKESVIHNLFKRYGEATAMYIKSLKKQKAGKKRPRYEKCLNEVRKEIFEKLKPLLKCKLGKKESPVFAFPLLLKLDPQTEKLFTHSFMWQFECQGCGHSYQQRNQKTMTTFTKVLPEWRPLNAVHIGPCNQCQNTGQKRSMVLEKLSSVFMVHFVEGLPSSNLKEYSFQFKGHSYEIKTVIKYKNNHFCTWISNNDGTWLESDDLRGSFCRRHQQFRVRADDIHIVIWERTNGQTFEDNVELDEAVQDSINVSMVEGLSSSLVDDAEPSQQITPAVALNTSDPLAGMEGFADDDVITLTLVEVPLDANGRPIETVTELPPPDTCSSLVEASNEDAHSVELEPSTNVQLKSQEDCSLTLPVSSDASAETVPLRNCSVMLSPLKPVGDAIATSTPNQKPSDTKNSLGGNWMTRLLNPLSANKKTVMLKPCAPLKVTDADAAPKKAQNFNGFQGRSRTQSSVLASKIFPANTASTPSFSVPIERVTPVSKPSPAPAASDFRIPRTSGLDCGRLLSKEGRSSSKDKIHKLRQKLLKQLKAKKNELAILEKYAKTQQSGDRANGVPQGGFNRKEHLRGYLQELQEQIDHADNDSVCTMSSSTSICSSPGDAEFFAELFSPSPPVNQPNDGKYLDMLADGCGIAAAGQLQQANADQGGGDVLQPTSQPSHYPTTSTANASREESLNLMSNSTLALLNEGNDYFDFDDYF